MAATYTHYDKVVTLIPCQPLSLVDCNEVWVSYSNEILKLPASEKGRMLNSDEIWDRRLPMQQHGPLLLLRRLLEDPAVITKDDSVWYHYPFESCSEYSTISVQNLATIQIAWAFEREIPIKPNRTESEWAAIRESMTVLLDDRLKSLAARTP